MAKSTVVQASLPIAQLCLGRSTGVTVAEIEATTLCLLLLTQPWNIHRQMVFQIYFSLSLCVCLCEYVRWAYQEPNSDLLKDKCVLLTSELSDDTQDSFVDKQIKKQRI